MNAEVNKIKLSEDTLTLFAKALVPDIREFYQSEEGQQYFDRWIKAHPEYAEAEQTNNPHIRQNVQ